MSGAGGIFSLIVAEGRQDHMLRSTALLNDRVRKQYYDNLLRQLDAEKIYSLLLHVQLDRKGDYKFTGSDFHISQIIRLIKDLKDTPLISGEFITAFKRFFGDHLSYRRRKQKKLFRTALVSDDVEKTNLASFITNKYYDRNVLGEIFRFV